MRSRNFKLALGLLALLAVSLGCTSDLENIGLATAAPTEIIVDSPTQAPALPTDTTAPVPTAEPTAEPNEPDENVLFADDFSNTNSGWDIYEDPENPNGVTKYEADQFKIGVYTSNYFYWANPHGNFEDVAVEVMVQKSSEEDDVMFGLICRHVDVENFYSLVISADGYAAIRKRFEGSELAYLVDWTDSPAVLRGNQLNLLRAECVGDHLSLFVNGQLVIETHDSDLIYGDVGLLGGTFEAEQLEVFFDNFTVYTP